MYREPREGILEGNGIDAACTIELVSAKTAYKGIILIITGEHVIKGRSDQAFYTRDLIEAGGIAGFLLPGNA